jgi:hypothetical protein
VKDYAGMISEEQVQLLDLDAVAWFATEDEARKLAKNRVYNSLDVLVPALAAAVDGDTTTVPPAKD